MKGIDTRLKNLENHFGKKQSILALFDDGSTKQLSLGETVIAAFRSTGGDIHTLIAEGSYTPEYPVSGKNIPRLTGISSSETAQSTLLTVLLKEVNS